MLGPLVNAATIIVCALVGKFLVRNVPERVSDIIMKAIAACLIYIGVSGAMQSERMLLLILSMIIGSIIGELINIDKGMNKLGKWAENKLGSGDSDFSKGFVTATIVFCVGSMAIVGSLESGLTGNHEILFAKSVLDGVMAVVFASQMGLGVLFSFVPVLLYQGGIVLGASFVKVWLTTEIITEMSAVGSLLISVIGFNFLGLKEIKVANMIPAIFFPWIFIAIENMIF
jgi:uncharacterized membrane protein YqgA involved in biofilm formation